jgi:hypothetical protein
MFLSINVLYFIFQQSIFADPGDLKSGSADFKALSNLPAASRGF